MNKKEFEELLKSLILSTKMYTLDLNWQNEKLTKADNDIVNYYFDKVLEAYSEVYKEGLSKGFDIAAEYVYLDFDQIGPNIMWDDAIEKFNEEKKSIT